MSLQKNIEDLHIKCMEIQIENSKKIISAKLNGDEENVFVYEYAKMQMQLVLDDLSELSRLSKLEFR